MKRLIAAGVIAAAAAATLAGCSVSTTQPLAFTAEKCSALTPAIQKSFADADLGADAKLTDSKGTCTWSADGGTLTLAVDGSTQSVDVMVGTESPREKIAKDSTKSIIDNDRLSGADGVLYTAKGSAGDPSREFVGTDGDGRATLTAAGVDATDTQVSKVFSALFTG